MNDVPFGRRVLLPSEVKLEAALSGLPADWDYVLLVRAPADPAVRVRFSTSMERRPDLAVTWLRQLAEKMTSQRGKP